MSATWLHVSDFHLRAGANYDSDVVLRALVAGVSEHRKKGRVPDLILATGDVAYSGRTQEYEVATAFFDALLKAADLPRDRLFVVPGNHDVDRSQGVGLARTLGSREEVDAYFDPALPKPHITQKLAAFRDWYDRYFAGIRSFPATSSCFDVEVLQLRDLRIAVLPLNSALFCADDHDHNKLLIGRRPLDGAIAALDAATADLRIALMHHPLDWLNDVERSNVKTTLQGRVDVILRGHLHETEAELVASAAGATLHLAAGAAYQTRKWPNRAMYATFDGHRLRVFPIRYEDSPKEIWIVDPSVFPEEPTFEGTLAVPRLSGMLGGFAVAPVDAAALPRYRTNVASRGNTPFIGRETELERIAELLADPCQERVVLLHGPPGVGKSELAREFARRYRDRYPGGAFFVYSGAGAEMLDLARVGANLLGLRFPPDASIRDQCERTLAALGAESVLLIYDNAMRYGDIQPWLPASGIACHVLVTSVNERLMAEWPALSIERLGPGDSLDLISQVAGAEVARRHGPKLVAMADGLPIQIVPASRALAYEARRGRGDSSSLVVAPEAQSSFQLVYDTLEPSVRLLLHTACFMAARGFDRREFMQPLTNSAQWTTPDFEKALDVCLDLHLLEGDDQLRMHQLFAAFLSDIALVGALADSVRGVREQQLQRFLGVSRQVAAAPGHRELAAAFLSYPLEIRAWTESGLDVDADDCTAVGSGLFEIGKFDEARPWCERAVGAAERGDVHGRVDHDSLGKSLHQVGSCLSSVGSFAEARPWYERAVEEKEQGDVHGRVDHASLGRSLHTVGYCLSSVGSFAEARPWCERAVEAAERGDVHGRVDHESLGRSLHLVGFCLSSVGSFAEARPWCERAVEAAERGDVHGRVDHESLGRSLHQVGSCLSRVGSFAEARPWYERAVEEKERGDVHGRVDHESLGRSLHQVGSCLSSVGSFAEARPWCERAVEAAERGDVHGRVDHASLGTSMRSVATCLRAVGQEAAAKQWDERAERLPKGD